MRNRKTRHGRALMLVIAIAAMTVMMATPASSSHEQRTKGRFTTLAGGTALGYEIDGRAIMWRTAEGDDGTTTVVVQVRGLDPGTTYPTHVHNGPCSAVPPGGGHYQHEVGGPVDPVNEIWPVVTTDGEGIGWGDATHAHWARREARAVVIHYPLDTSIRLACADLR